MLFFIINLFYLYILNFYSICCHLSILNSVVSNIEKYSNLNKKFLDPMDIMDLEERVFQTCFPKDTKSLLNEIKIIDMKSYIISSMDERNDTVDRKEADWKNNKGRSVVD